MSPPESAISEVAVPLDLLQQIADRLERVERRLEGLEEAIAPLPGAAAMAVDTADELLARAQQDGLDVDQALGTAVRGLEKLARPEVSGRLLKILDKLDVVEESLEMAARLPDGLAAFTDMADAFVAASRERGVDWEARAKLGLSALEQLSAPESVKAVQTLVQQLPQLAELVDNGPRVLAVMADAVDDLIRDAQSRGVDVENLLGNMVTVLNKVRETLDSPEFVALMNSGVLAPCTLAVIGSAGEALAATQTAGIPERVGLFGALRRSGDADLQRALGFALDFGRRFGTTLGRQKTSDELADCGCDPPQLTTSANTNGNGTN